MRKITEDARQSARLLLLERGDGLSVISDLDSPYVKGAAKRMVAREFADSTRELVAWCQSEGVYPDNYEELLSIAYQRDRQRKPVERKYTHAKSKAERNERRRKTWRESKARAYARKKLK